MSQDYSSRKNPRLKGYNYAIAGLYFVTICTHHREETLSRIVDANVILTDIGVIVEKEWLRSAEIRKEIELHDFVIMPNHTHAIVRITKTTARSHTKGLERHSLSSLITGFKSSVTKHIREKQLVAGAVWQRGYYEHIIRDEGELMRIGQYIAENPARWQYDRENVLRLIEKMEAR